MDSNAMSTRKRCLKIRVCVLVGFTLGSFVGAKICYSQENKPEYRGVSGAEVRNEFGKRKSGKDAWTVGMGDWLIVEASNLDGWLYASVKDGYFPNQEWFDPDGLKAIANLDLKTLYEKTRLTEDNPESGQLRQVRESVEKMLSDVKQGLYLQLGPARLRHLHAEDPLIKQAANGIFRFAFRMRETTEDRTEWNKLRSIHTPLRPISISLAFEIKGVTHTLRTKLGSSLESGSAGRPEDQFYFRVFSWSSVVAIGLAYLVALLMFYFCAAAPNLLRDQNAPLRDGRHIFSLSRCQLAWWFFVIFLAWSLLLVITHSADTLNKTALILLGIGSGTALTGAVAGNVKESLRKDGEKKLSEEELNLADRPKAFRKGGFAFLYDLLSDTDTVGFHRFQLVVWNVILGVIFVFWTWTDFAMPEFDSTILGLLGISAATFVGMKMTVREIDKKA
jgi:hypothetical protein